MATPGNRDESWESLRGAKRDERLGVAQIRICLLTMPRDVRGAHRRIGAVSAILLLANRAGTVVGDGRRVRGKAHRSRQLSTATPSDDATNLGLATLRLYIHRAKKEPMCA